MQITKINNLIIGAGISGCIFADIIKNDYLIIERSSKIGGEINNVILGPKMFHATPETEQFFNKYIKNKYIVKNITLKEGIECNDKSKYDSKIGYSFKNSKNSSINEFTALDLDLDDFYNNKNIISNANLIKIDISAHKVYVLYKQKIMCIKYNNLISTIDYELLINLCGLYNNFNLKRRGVLYVNLKADYNTKFRYLSEYNFWYNLTNKEFFRCTNLKQSKTIELFVEDYDYLEKSLYNYFDNVSDLNYYYNPNAKIWNESEKQIAFNLLKSYNIYLLGRNAMYNHDRIQDSIVTANLIKKEIE